MLQVLSLLLCMFLHPHQHMLVEAVCQLASKMLCNSATGNHGLASGICGLANR